MATNMEQRYQERLARYVTAMRNEKPDKIPVRPFVAEFTSKYAGMTCQDVSHDYNNAFIAARKCFFKGGRPGAGYDQVSSQP